MSNCPTGWPLSDANLKKLLDEKLRYQSTTQQGSPQWAGLDQEIRCIRLELYRRATSQASEPAQAISRQQEAAYVPDYGSELLKLAAARRQQAPAARPMPWDTMTPVSILGASVSPLKLGLGVVTVGALGYAAYRYWSAK